MAQWHQSTFDAAEALVGIFKFFDRDIAPLFPEDWDLRHATRTKVEEEIGELQEIISKDYVPDPVVTEMHLNLEVAREMADVIACCFLWARAYNIDLGGVLRQKMEVVGNRKQERTPEGTWHHVKE